jgi:hypothetical protein
MSNRPRRGVMAMSENRQDARHTAGRHKSHRAIPTTTQRLTPARAASFMLCNLGAAAIAVVIGVAVVLVFRFAAVDRSLFMSDSAARFPRPTAPLPGLSKWQRMCCPAS